MAAYYVYILASRPGGALYVGVTRDLTRRTYQHKTKELPGHAQKYNIDRLVYFETFETPIEAIQREKNMKHWPRSWKTRLVAESNPEWRDLYDDIVR